MAAKCVALFAPSFHTGNKFDSVPLTEASWRKAAGGFKRAAAAAAAESGRP